MSMEALRWAFPLVLTGAKKAVLLALAEHADAKGKCFPSIPRIAVFAGVSERAAQIAISRLAVLGVLQTDRSKGGKGHSSDYYLNIGCEIATPPSGGGQTVQHVHPNGHANGEARSGFRPSTVSQTVQHVHPMPVSNGESAAPKCFQTVNQIRQTVNQVHPNPKEPPSKKASDVGTSEPEGSRAAPADARSLLWSNGLQDVRFLTGQSDGGGRRLLGKLLRDAKDDCSAVSLALQQAVDLRPIDPVSWLTQAVKVEKRIPGQWLYEMFDPAIADSGTIDGELCPS